MGAACDGITVDVRATRAGCRWRSIGENIAAGQMTTDLAVQGCLNSPGHCANIMAPNFEEMGAAFVVNTQSKSEQQVDSRCARGPTGNICK